MRGKVCKFLSKLRKLEIVYGSVVENVGDVERVEIINISDHYLYKNSVEHIPREILNGKKPTELYLSYRNLISVPSDISLIQNLVLLDLSNNLLTDLCKLPLSLTCINLYANKFENFPPALKELENLECIRLNRNKITELSKTIGHFSKLNFFDISHNELKKFSSNAENFNNLKTLDLSYNYLTDMKSICKIKTLQSLNIDFNRVAEFSKNIGNLKNLVCLNSSKNKILNLSDEIKKCKKLNFLDLSKNLLTEFEALCFNESLKQLNIHQNRILKIPKKICNLKELFSLCLSDNKISELPLELNECKNLKYLNLKNNCIEVIPINLFQRLSNLRFLDLSENPFKYPADITDLDILELKSKMGSRLKLDNDLVELKKVYEQLKEKKICFNFFNLRKCRPLIIPTHIFLEQELYEKIKEFQEKSEKLKHEYTNKKINILDPNQFTYEVKSFDTKILIDYIHHLYNPKDYYNKWNIPKDLISDFKKYIGAIVFKLFNSDDMLYIEGHLISLSTAICYCYERQKAELIFLYELLVDEDDKHIKNICKSGLIPKHGSSEYVQNLKKYIEDTIKKLIGTSKNKILESLFINRKNQQNVHICDYWKYLLQDHVGIDVLGNKPIIYAYDKFNGKLELGLHAFFQNFTPEWLFLEITDFINCDGDLVCKIAEYLYYSNIKNKNRFIECENDDILFTKCVTLEFCKYILTSMEIIIINRN